jgi:hypothetical protein
MLTNVNLKKYIQKKTKTYKIVLFICIKRVKLVFFVHEKVFYAETQVEAVKTFECTKDIFMHER